MARIVQKITHEGGGDTLTTCALQNVDMTNAARTHFGDIGIDFSPPRLSGMILEKSQGRFRLGGRSGYFPSPSRSTVFTISGFR